MFVGATDRRRFAFVSQRQIPHEAHSSQRTRHRPARNVRTFVFHIQRRPVGFLTLR